jgi:hypothetical protein
MSDIVTNELVDLGKVTATANKTIGISLDTEKEYHWIWYKGQQNLTLKETLLLWGKLTDWVVSRARVLEGETGDSEVSAHVIKAFAKKIVELGKEEYEQQN